MNRATPVFLALVVVSSLLVIPVASESGADVTAENPDPALRSTAFHFHQGPVMEAEGTTNRLRLTGDIRTERTEHGTDVGLALTTFDDQLRVDQEQYTLIDSEFATASDDEREKMVRAAYTRITERAEELEEREKEVVRAHARGTLSDTELIRALLRNQNEAAILYDALEQLRGRTDDISNYSLSLQQIRADKTLLQHQQTPLRANLEHASQPAGAGQPVDVLVQTSENGYSLSMIDGDMYLRETVRFDHRDADAENQFEDATYSETIEHVTELYPWAGEVQGWSSFSDSSNENIYTMMMEVDRNQLAIHLDAGTGEVYREIQELSLASLPKANTDSWTNNDLVLSLERTPAHGPAKVTVTEADSDEPVTATVSIDTIDGTDDGTEIGETDDDGTLWILPPGDEYELTVETDDGAIEATVTND